MTENVQRHTAIIIPFPVRQRSASNNHGERADAPASTWTGKRVATDAWYHDAAIQEEALPVQH